MQSRRSCVLTAYRSCCRHPRLDLGMSALESKYLPAKPGALVFWPVSRSKRLSRALTRPRAQGATEVAVTARGSSAPGARPPAPDSGGSSGSPLRRARPPIRNTRALRRAAHRRAVLPAMAAAQDMNDPTNDPPVVMPACAGVDLGKKWLNRRPGFVTKPVLVRRVRSVHPVDPAGLNLKIPAIPSA
jgi:hypothetical protein